MRHLDLYLRSNIMRGEQKNYTHASFNIYQNFNPCSQTELNMNIFHHLIKVLKDFHTLMFVFLCIMFYRSTIT